jgi:RNA recognition motif-containing protein
MGKKIYVGNLPFSASNETLEATFAQFGTVESARIITDRDTGRSKGFAFVEMSSETEAQNAINSMNGKDFDGRTLTVNEAKPMVPRDGERRGGFGGEKRKNWGGNSRFGGGRGNSGRGGSRY